MALEDINCIESIAKIVTELDLESVDYNKDGLHIIVTNRSKSVAPVMPVQTVAPAPVSTSSPVALDVIDNKETSSTVSKGETVKSPMVGVLYLAASPNDPAYVKVGDNVKEGDILCLIEAMKTFNQIKAPKSGVIREILATSGAAVEYDEPLFVIE